MPFEKIPFTLELLGSLVLQSTGKGGLAYINRRAGLIFICRYCGDNGDFYEELSLFDSGEKFSIQPRQKKTKSGKVFTTFVIESSIALSKQKNARLRKYGRDCLALYVEEIGGSGFDVEILDWTKATKPRSIATLKKLLQIFADTNDKMAYRSAAMNLFIPLCFRIEEAKLFDSYIHATKGKRIPLISLLIFELAYEKYKSRTSTSAKDKV